MARADISLTGAILTSEPRFTQSKNGDVVYITAKVGNDIYFVSCFDEGENPKSTYKKVQHMKLKKGSVMNLSCRLYMKEREFIPADRWDKLMKLIPPREKELLFPGGANPTCVQYPYFKLIDLDFAIPEEIMRAYKEGIQ